MSIEHVSTKTDRMMKLLVALLTTECVRMKFLHVNRTMMIFVELFGTKFTDKWRSFRVNFFHVTAEAAFEELLVAWNALDLVLVHLHDKSLYKFLLRISFLFIVVIVVMHNILFGTWLTRFIHDDVFILIAFLCSKLTSRWMHCVCNIVSNQINFLAR